ncbi:MAG: hypothetical protein A3I78_04445 [Gammaproteobacteria bacterium RIFCSPLOWO2_02_FULL_56_15]|nr:MAG: hypothetical protein A3I78_04445 [Gammaproteobacteria bacterium RIFCSPLOWO2_02_FULL_56_15]
MLDPMNPNPESGFTLIELAMVLFIIALLLGGLLSPLSTRMEMANRTRTQDSLGDIKESLLGYAVIHGRLPCPDCPDGNVGTCSAVAAANRNDGIEDLSGTPPARVCQAQTGNIPWVDLGVTESDAWGRHFSYTVSAEFSRESQDGSPPPCGAPAINVSFELCSEGDLDIYSAYASPYVPPPTVAEKVPAVVISHGKDMYESDQTDAQVENYDRSPVNPDTGSDILGSYNAPDYSDGIFVYADYSLTDGEIAFDDLMIWISPAILYNRMILSGKLP